MEMKTNPTFDVFLSYSRPDVMEVEHLARVLSEAGLEVWFDRWELAPGHAWTEAMAAAVRRSSVLIVCIGPAGAGSWQCGEARSEDLNTRDLNCVIPVLLPGAGAESLPASLEGFACVDLRKGIEDSDQIARLLADVRAAARWDQKSSADQAERDDNLAVAYNKVGDRLLALGQHQQAHASYLKALSIRKRLVASAPHRADYQRDLSVSFDRMGDLYSAIGQLEESRTMYFQSLEIAMLLAAAEPERADYQRDLSVSYGKLGRLYDILGQLEEARKMYFQSIEISERLAAAEPERADYQRDLSVSYNNVGDVESAQGHLIEALKAYRGALKIRDQLAKKNPDNVRYQRDLSVSYNNVGDLYRSLGQSESARSAYLHSLAIVERLVSQDPNNANWQRDLSVLNSNVGDLYRSLGQWEDARSAYLYAFVIAERLASQDPNNANWQRDLSVSCSKVGDVYRFLKQWQDARSAYLHSLAITESLASQQPSNAAWQRDLSISCSKVGDVYCSLDQWQDARSAYLRSLAIAERLVSQDPSNVAWQRDLSVLHQKVGNILFKENLSDEQEPIARRGRLAAGSSSALINIQKRRSIAKTRRDAGSKQKGVFLGHSGSLSKDLAEIFCDFLREVLSPMDPFFINGSLPVKGRWVPAIDAKFAQAEYGIFFITQANAETYNWMLYEAGAITAVNHSSNCVVPILVDIPPEELPPVYFAFQWMRFEKDSCRKLVAQLHNESAAADTAEHALIDSRFRQEWPKLRERWDKIVTEDLKKKRHREERKEKKRLDTLELERTSVSFDDDQFYLWIYAFHNVIRISRDICVKMMNDHVHSDHLPAGWNHGSVPPSHPAMERFRMSIRDILDNIRQLFEKLPETSTCKIRVCLRDLRQDGNFYTFARSVSNRQRHPNRDYKSVPIPNDCPAFQELQETWTQAKCVIETTPEKGWGQDTLTHPNHAFYGTKSVLVGSVIVDNVEEGIIAHASTLWAIFVSADKENVFKPYHHAILQTCNGAFSCIANVMLRMSSDR
jgi:tetratricopeptide (TPR) repeat protein